jgi:hypothetical protein
MGLRSARACRSAAFQLASHAIEGTSATDALAQIASAATPAADGIERIPRTLARDGPAFRPISTPAKRMRGVVETMRRQAPTPGSRRRGSRRVPKPRPLGRLRLRWNVSTSFESAARPLVSRSRVP